MSVQFSTLFNRVCSRLDQQRLQQPLARIIDYNGKDPFFATLTVGLICCMRAFSSTKNSAGTVSALVDQYEELLKNYTHKAVNHSTRGWFAWLRWEKIKLADMPIDVVLSRVPAFVDHIMDVSTDYYDVQKAVYNLINEGLTDSEFHEDYNNYLTFICLAFFRIDRVSKEECVRFVSQLVRFHFEDKLCVYDNYQYAGEYEI